MSIKCLLDNCPHHATQKGPPEKVGMLCGLKICAWDQPTITDYLNAVRDCKDDSLHQVEAATELDQILGDQSCNNSQEENT